MATHDNFVVAVELGSSKVSAVAGEKQPDGVIQILAFAQEPSENFIRKGRIYNIDKFGQCLGNLKERLEKQVGMSISKAYVGIGGMGMHSVLNTITKQYPQKVKVTEQMIDALQDENNSSQPTERDIIGVIPQEYKVESHRTNDPVGVLTQTLTGNYLNLITSAQTKQQIVDSFAQSRIVVVDLPVTFLSLADKMLNDRQRQSGCVFVDMGAQTTSVAIYKSGLLRHLAVIPLGGENITTDIATAYQVDMKEAEEIKLKYNFGMEFIDEEDQETFSTSDDREYPLNDLKKLVSARLEEIILNVKYQIDLSQYTLSQLMSGIILTGGTSKTGGIDSAFKFLAEMTLPVQILRTGLKPAIRKDKQHADFNDDGSYDCVIALLEKCEENCCGGSIGQTIGLFEKETSKEVEVSEGQDEGQQSIGGSDGRITDPNVSVGEPELKEKPEKKPSNLKKKWGKFMDGLKSKLTTLVSEDPE